MAADNVIIVSNSSELSAALKNASGGETILLKGGNYGDLVLTDVNFNSEVTISSYDPDDMAAFATVDINYSSNITFDTIEVDFVPTSTTYAWTPAVEITNSSDITFKNSHLEGEVATSGDGSGGGPLAGYPSGRAFTILNSDDVTIENNDISAFQIGITPANVDGLTIAGNEIHDLRGSPVTGGNVRNVDISDNYFHSINPVALGGTGDHADYIHLWITADQTQPSDDVVISNNFMSEGDGQSLVGIYLENHGNMSGYQFSNVVIEENVLYSHGQQGIRVEGIQGLEITSNTIIQNDGGDTDGPAVVLAFGVDGAVITDNIFSAPIALAAGSEYNKNIYDNNNLLVQITDVDGEHYIGSLFVNPLAGNPSLADLKALSGSVIEQMGVGSSMTLLDGSSDGPAGIIDVDSGTGFNMLTQSFDLSLLTGSDSGASVTWSFGDGTSTTSTSPTHSYDSAGEYNVSALVKFSDGETVTINKTIIVESPVALNANFNGTAADTSDDVNSVSMSNSVSIEQSGGRQAIRLDGGTVSYEADTSFRGNDAYTLLFDFKKDPGSENSGGYAVYYSKSFVVSIGANSVQAAITTDKGTEWFTVNNVGINDSDWHQVAITFSGEDGQAKLYVDGEQGANIPGLAGAVQTGSVSHDFVLGGPFGGSFDGLIDDVRFYKDAMSEAQVEESYAKMGTIDENTAPPVSDGDPVIDDPVVEDPVDDDPVVEDPVDDDPVVEDPVDDDPVVEDPVDDDPVVEDPVDDDPIVDVPVDGDIQIAALNKAADEFGDGLQNLGRGEEYFGFDDFTASITFALDSTNGGSQRMLWNHSNYGIEVKGDNLVVYFTEEGKGMEIFVFKDAIQDTAWHDVQLVLDGEADTFSIYLDGQMLDQEEGVTGGITENARWDVTVDGTLFNNGDGFNGQIADFSIIDEAVEIDSSMSVYERTVAIDALDDHNGSQVEMIGIALQDQDALDFA